MPTSTLVLVKNKTINITLMLFLIWADEKYNIQKNPCVVCATQKSRGVFHRPKKIPFGQNVRHKRILWTPPPPSLKYVSGAPGGVGEGELPFSHTLPQARGNTSPLAWGQACFVVLCFILFFLHLLIIIRECFTLEKGCKEVRLDEGAYFSKLLDSSGFCSWF